MTALVRRGEVRSRTPLNPGYIRIYPRIWLFVRRRCWKPQPDLQHRWPVPKVLVPAYIYIYIYIYRYPGFLEVAKQAAKFSPFAYNYPSSGSPHIRAGIPVIHGRSWLGFRVKFPIASGRRFLTGSSVFEGQFFGEKQALPFTLKLSILRQKKNYGNSNISPCKNIIFKNSSKTNQNPSRYYYNSIITKLKFQHKPKYHLSKILI